MFADRMKEIRTEAGLTMDDASALVGSSHATWSNWENGRNFPKPEWIKAIAKEFGVTEQWLETGKGEKTPEQEQAKTVEVQAKKRDEAVTVYNREDEERLRDVEAVIKFIKEMPVPKERKRHIHKTMSGYRAELESVVLFGELR